MPSEVFHDFVLKISMSFLPCWVDKCSFILNLVWISICGYHSCFAQDTLVGKFVSILIFQFILGLQIVISFTCITTNRISWDFILQEINFILAAAAPIFLISIKKSLILEDEIYLIKVYLFSLLLHQWFYLPFPNLLNNSQNCRKIPKLAKYSSKSTFVYIF